MSHEGTGFLISASDSLSPLNAFQIHSINATAFMVRLQLFFDESDTSFLCLLSQYLNDHYMSSNIAATELKGETELPCQLASL